MKHSRYPLGNTLNPADLNGVGGLIDELFAYPSTDPATVKVEEELFALGKKLLQKGVADRRTGVSELCNECREFGTLYARWQAERMRSVREHELASIRSTEITQTLCTRVTEGIKRFFSR